MILLHLEIDGTGQGIFSSDSPSPLSLEAVRSVVWFKDETFPLGDGRVAPPFFRHVHLMLTRPDLYLEPFAAAGAQTIQIHVEADCDLHVELPRIRALGLRAAIALNPETPSDAVFPYLGLCDEVLVMTVHPGYGGQSFIADCLPKITAIRRRAPDLDIMVDGGINAETARLASQAGANQLVAGSYLFKQSDMAAAVAALRQDCADYFLRP